MSKFLLHIIFFAGVFIIVSCNRTNREIPEDKQDETKESLLKINKILVKKDADKINAYVDRRGWKMQETETGLWYMIYEKGNGRKAEKNKIAKIAYTVELLNGTECYNSDSLGFREFKISEGGVESGLEEGILLLKEGDKAKFILPPHLAHGLIGDENCIPARSIIVYDVILIELKEPN